MDSVPFNFFFLLILVFTSSSLAQTNGRIPVGTSLTATQNSSPWLSSSADFAFGFQFLPQNGLFLLSIWYYNLPEKTIVWYANDGNLVPSGSTLELNAQNGLVLTDPQGNQLWSTPILSTIDHGFINNTGNFVLLGSDSSISWQSFENPTDTLLPTQTMEIGGELNSRISDTNFSQGKFQFRLIQDGNAVLNRRDVLSNQVYEAYFWSNTYDSSNSSNSGRQLVFDETGQIFVVRRNGQISILPDQTMPRSPEYYYRATLNFDGVFVIYSHPKQSNGEQNWTAIWTKPDNICLSIFGKQGPGVSGACGYNSICKPDNNRRPVCECPFGYSLLDPNDKYGSCKPSLVQSCDESGQHLGKDLYRLQELRNTDWPWNDYAQTNPFSEDNCRNSCLSDCFCAVAIYNDNSCWKKKLPLSNGRRDYDFTGKAFLKLNKRDFRPKGPDSLDPFVGPRTKQGTFSLVSSMLLGSSVFFNFVLLGVGFFGFFSIYKKKINRASVGNKNIVENNLCAFSYEVLVQATNSFKDELGRGAFSLVYKGVLDIGGTRSNVAIKKLDRVFEDGEKEFRAEVNVIAHTRHKNLVRLLGFCDDGENRLLVYEYMSNGTIASFLFGDTKPSWNLRTRIAFGIARGLLYLHEECTTQIIHCDIKSHNVLLDECYNAKISDFGLAKLLMVDQSRILTAIRGTKGYVAPEWFRNTPVTVKVDVYSFGVLLLEIVSCRKTLEYLGDGAREREILTDWVWDCFQERKLEALVENDAEALNDMKILERFVMVGIWCIQEDPFLRPSMRKVSQMLEGVVEVIPPPCPFPFSTITMGSEK
ncbi:hypothetical protein LguiA_021727 [Lonicera macranthoides]